jgi:(E)-4-hydroxy-3-methylbut-2-enyl-diphosphate synthase
MSYLTKEITVGGKKLGGTNPILIQTMADIKTSRVEEIVKMEQDLALLGNDLLRLSVLDEEDVEAFKRLSKACKTPLIADIHFNWRFGVGAIDNGASACRINPGNIGSQANLDEVIAAAKAHHIPLRIGVNSGSLPKAFVSKKAEAEAYVDSLSSTVSLMESRSFTDLVLSLKSSDPEVTYQAYKLAASRYNYPLHIGVTEAGPSYLGALRSAVGLVPLLKEGIGNTIRISLTDPPRDEVIAAKALLKALGLKKDVAVLVSCPTCGRTQVDLKRLSKLVMDKLAYVNKDIKVAVMGCPVNGPGEARDADLGLAGGIDSYLVFKKGQPVGSFKEKEALDYLFKEIDKLAK